MKKRGAKANSGKKPDFVFVAPVRPLSREASSAVLRLMALTCLETHRPLRHREYGRSLLLAAGQAGDRDACRLLSDYYRAGSHGFPQDKERHLHWWLRSERRLWSEQTPLYRYRQWMLSWSAEADKRTIM